MNGALRYVRDFLTAELKRLRPGWVTPAWDNADWDPEASFDKAPLFLDSLELVEVAGLFADRLHLREAGLEDLLLAFRSLSGWARLVERSRETVSQVSFFTSGSTGLPQKTEHSWYWLQKEAEFFAKLLLARPLVKAVPSHHIYGFIWTWLVGEALGAPVRELDLGAPLWHPGELVITTPFLLHLWLERQLPVEGTQFILSSAPFPDQDAERLISRGATFLEVFGSTETAGIGWRTKPGEGFRLLPWWSLVEEGLMRTGEQGQQVFQLPDHLEQIAPQVVRPQGRKDLAVMIGGVNVIPAQVEQKLARCPWVAQVAVRLGTQGRLKAFIVPRPDASNHELETSLRDWARQNLLSPERPASYTFGSQLPRTEVGKSADW